MKLFEATWKDEYNYFERFYNTDTKKSEKRKITIPHEWYEPSSNGPYTFILDETIRLEKKQGNPKNGRDQYGFLDPMYRNIRDNYWDKNSFNLEPRIWYLDIETRVGQNSTGFPVPNKADEEISLIQIYDNKENVVIMLGSRDWKHQSDYKLDYKTKYINCKNEYNLIETFLNIFKQLDPLIIYAWNGMGFDFPYIFNRLKKLNIDTNRLSNYGKAELKEEIWFNDLVFKFKSNGHFWIDFMEVYKTFTFQPRPSYALDIIAEIEVGEKKVQHSEYAAFDDFYTGKYIIPMNPTKEQLDSKIYQHAIKFGIDDELKELSHSNFCYYGWKDPLLIKKIDDKLNFSVLMCMIAEKMGVQIEDSTATLKPWSHFILNRSYKDNKIMPPRHENPSPNVIGGYVRTPEIGKHKWVLSADVNSMYPLLGMVGFNMSPETFVAKGKLPADLREMILMNFNNQIEDDRFKIPEEKWERTTNLLKKYNYSLAINGAVFDKSKLGMIPEIVQNIYNGRKQEKKIMFKYQQRKILIKELLKQCNS